MRETDYAYAVANVRANENKLLTFSDIQTMLATQNADDIMAFLFDKGWSSEQININDYEKMLSLRESKMFDYIRELSPSKDIFDIMLYKNDFHNLKVILKSKIAGMGYENNLIMPCIVDPKLIYKAAEEFDFSALPQFLAVSAKEAYDVLTQTLDGQLCDIIIDKNALKMQLDKAKQTKNSYITELYEKIAASADIKIAVRAARTNKSYDFIMRALCECKYFDTAKLAQAAVQGEGEVYKFIAETPFAPGIKLAEVSMSAFEKWCDDYIMEHVKTAKYKPFGVEPLVAFLFACENEIKIVRIIISGKLNSLEDEKIMQRVRELYV